jgi:anaerobic selenocysteine-containing dehydrogenase
LWFLHVLTGSVGTVGGTSPNTWDKFKPAHWNMPPPHSKWNELLWPKEYPLAHHEMSILLPHLLKEGRGKVDVYFSRVYNPIWTNPDGFSWLEVLTDEDLVGLHVALTPTWSETAWFADYVLPMGVASERHDTQSYATYAGRWLGFRQPVLRVAGEKNGAKYERTYDANPGQVWEETEFFFDLSWRIDPDGSLGIRQWFESPEDPERVVSVDEYYGWMFDNSVPGLPETAAEQDLTPLQFMRKFGAYEIDKDVYSVHERPAAGGVEVDGAELTGWPTESGKLEWYSQTLNDWGWEDASVPTYLKTHVYWRDMDMTGNERILLPIFRLPTLIHTRSGNAKYLYEISHGHPLWMNPHDADALGFDTGEMIRISTDIGYFVMRVWRTEGIRPGVVSSRIWWQDAGVNQNLTFPVHPDPVSGMHAWHQRVRLSSAEEGDRYGDIFVDTGRSHEVYKEWLAMTKPAPGPGNMRRPLWIHRPVKPTRDAYEFRD